MINSVLDGETYVLLDCVDSAFSLRHKISKMIRKGLPITMSTDSKTLFKIFVKPSTVAEGISVIDIRTAKKAFE